MTGGVPATGYTVPDGTWRFADFADPAADVAGGEVLANGNRDQDRTDVWGARYDPRGRTSSSTSTDPLRGAVRGHRGHSGVGHA